jgi:Reverse transcriptase (RNA-dependent DNA polymerase)
MLFIIAVDALQRMNVGLNLALPHYLSPRVRQAVIALQYADDTIFIATARGEIIENLNEMLGFFSTVSGLHINRAKTCFVPFNMNPQDIQHITNILQCQTTSLPIQYLGLPLMTKQPSRRAFMPLLEKIEKRSAGWKGKLISRGGKMVHASRLSTCGDVGLLYVMFQISKLGDK